MMKANKALALVLTGAAAVSASAGYNEYTSTVTDGIKDVTLTANETIISDKLSGEGVDALRFTRSSNFIPSSCARRTATTFRAASSRTGTTS